VLEHLDDHYRLYGEAVGVRTARKHLCWYSRTWPDGEGFRADINRIHSSVEQIARVEALFDSIARQGALRERPAVAADDDTSEQREALAA